MSVVLHGLKHVDPTDPWGWSPEGKQAASRRLVECGGGSGWSSRLAVRTGRLRSSRIVHVRPIDLVVFQEPTQRLLLEA